LGHGASCHRVCLCVALIARQTISSTDNTILIRPTVAQIEKMGRSRAVQLEGLKQRQGSLLECFSGKMRCSVLMCKCVVTHFAGEKQISTRGRPSECLIEKRDKLCVRGRTDEMACLAARIKCVVISTPTSPSRGDGFLTCYAYGAQPVEVKPQAMHCVRCRQTLSPSQRLRRAFMISTATSLVVSVPGQLPLPRNSRCGVNCGSLEVPRHKFNV
jgi:hypothetical protein